MFLHIHIHTIWRNALSVLIHRGETVSESGKSPYNWSVDKYGDDSITDEVI
jgi:hypothetical protein